MFVGHVKEILYVEGPKGFGSRNIGINVDGEDDATLTKTRACSQEDRDSRSESLAQEGSFNGSA